MKGTALLLVFCLLLPALSGAAEDAPVAAPAPEGLVVREAQVLTEPEGQSVKVEGGCWLSTHACTSSAQRLAAAEAKAQVLGESPPALALPTALTAALGFVAGVLTVVLVKEVL